MTTNQDDDKDSIEAPSKEDNEEGADKNSGTKQTVKDLQKSLIENSQSQPLITTESRIEIEEGKEGANAGTANVRKELDKHHATSFGFVNSDMLVDAGDDG